METIYLVDGSGYIFRAFYAVAPLSSSKGLPTNALVGFTRMLFKLLRDVQAKYIAVCFDTGQPTFRHERYAAYKANRKECPAELVPQLPYFRKVVEALGVQSLEKPGFEADDVIATLAVRLVKLGHEVVIVSGDKDLTQLVNGYIRVWDAMRDLKYDAKVVKEKFGVEPKQMVDFLALVGDSSDNVPGAKGVGPKSAVALLEHFGNLEQVLQGLDRLDDVPGIRGAAGLKKKLELSIEQIRLSKELVTLDCEVEPFNQVSRVEELAWADIKEDLALPLFEELEISSSFLKLSGGNNSSKQNTQASNKYHTVTTSNFPDFLKRLQAVKEFAFDTETTSLDVLSCDLVGLSFSWEKGHAYYLPFRGGAGDGELLDPVKVREALNPVFSNPTVKKFGANLKFDLNVLRSQGYQVAGLAFDIMLASYVLHPDRRQHGLKDLSRNHLGVTMATFKDVVGDKESLAEVTVETASAYACADADMTYQLTGKLEQLLGANAASGYSPRYILEQIEMPLLSVLAEMERKGVLLDRTRLAEIGHGLASDLQRLEQSIYQLAAMTFNLNSPKQLSEVLFDKLQLPVKGVKRTQSSYSTDGAVLRKLLGHHPIIAQILEYRELFKLKSTYIDSLERLVHPKTGRIHTSFNQAVAATGRLSSSEPNLQNIPIRGERGKQIRTCFIAGEGCVLISADYSQIELRVLAEVSGDEGLRKAFREGEDIHSRTARDLFGEFALTETESRSQLRRVAKTINFGIIYGMGAFRLAEELKIPRKQAEQYIEQYFSRYPGVRRYFDELGKRAQEQGYVETYFGRRRYLQDLDTTGRDEGFALRSLSNAPIQGTAADVIKIAMIRLAAALRQFPDGQAQLVLQVHDELVVEAREAVSESVKNEVVRAMESAVAFNVPLKVDVKVARTWGDVQ